MAGDDEIVEVVVEFDAELVVVVDPVELDEEALEEEVEFGLADEEDGDDDEVLELEETEEDEDAEPAARRTVAEDEDDDEDLVDPDDVEADLDTILKDRLVASDDEAEDDEDEVEVDDRGDPVDRILPKRPGEFVCQSCFLVKHPSQLADAARMLCTDCV
jgi:hypothetical protein